MEFTLARTRYADSTPWQAATVLTALAALTAWCLLLSFQGRVVPGAPSGGGNDLRLYQRIVERVHAGESYYEAAGGELRARGYATRSVFNWRPPTYAWVLGALPRPEWGKAILLVLAAATLLMSFVAVGREGHAGLAVAGTLLMLGALTWCWDGGAYFAAELWAGVLIACSVSAAALRRWGLSVATGLLALFFRELALPYCGIALVLAWWQGRRREVFAWIFGLLAFVGFMTWHGLEVMSRISDADRAQATGWVQFGGPAFVMATCRMNTFLRALPTWVAAFYLPLALLGLAGWRGPFGLRTGLTAGAYVAAFAVVGLSFNDYWGLLSAPLLALGVVRAPVSLRDLYRSLRPSAAGTSQPLSPSRPPRGRQPTAPERVPLEVQKKASATEERVGAFDTRDANGSASR
jgi:hypothetical protein